VTFLAPGWLVLLGFVPVIVLFHVRRRRSAPVGSIMIWRRVRSTTPSRSLNWSAPQSWTSLLLQVAALALAVFALARPQPAPDVPIHHVVVLDASATMQAHIDGTSSFDDAATEARRRLAALSPNSMITLIQVTRYAEPLAVRRLAGIDSAALVDTIRPTDLRPSWQDAAATAAQFVRNGEVVRLMVITDIFGAVDSFRAFTERFEDEVVEIVTVGGPIVNVGLADVSVVSRGPTPHRWTVTGRVESVGIEREPLRIRAFFEPAGTQGFLSWAATDVIPDANGRAEFSIAIDLPGPGLLEIRTPPGDGLDSDDRAAFVLGERREIAVLRVGPENDPLDLALQSVPNVALYRSLVPPPPDTLAFDLVIIDRVEMERVPETSTAWIGVAPPGVPTAEELDSPRVTSWRTTHELGHDVDWAALRLERSLALATLEGSAVLAAAGDVPLVQARTTSNGRQVVVAFPLDESNWPAQLSFPAFVAALVDWATPGTSLSGNSPCRAGVPCGLPALAFGPDWQLLDPNGSIVMDSTIRIDVPDDPLAPTIWPDRVLDAGFVPDRVGIYRLQTPRGETPIPTHGSPAVAPLSPDVNEHTRDWSASGRAQTEWWRILAIMAGGAIACEAVLAGFRNERFFRRDHLRLLPQKQRAAGQRRKRTITMLTVVAVGGLGLTGAGVRMPTVVRTPDLVVVADLRNQAASRNTVLSEVLESGISGRVRHIVGITGDQSTTPGVLTSPDLTSALSIAASLAVDSAADTRVVVLPGREDTIDAATFVGLTRRLAEGAIPLDTVATAIPLLPSSLDVVAAALPERLRPGETFEVAVIVSSDRARRVHTEVAHGGVVLGSVASDLVTGANRVDVPVSLLVDVREVMLRVEVVDAADDRFAAAGQVAGSLVDGALVLVVAQSIELAEYFGRVLESQGLRTRSELPRRLPATLDRWTDLDTVVLIDVPAVAMHSAHQDLLKTWVRDTGGGLVIIGGPNSFGPGGYFQTDLEELSPLSARIPHDEPEVTLVFVLDRSGSMLAPVGPVSRLDIAVEATKGAIDQLASDSQVGIIVFDAAAEVIVPVQPISGARSLATELDSIRAGGGTAIYPALVEARRMVATVDSATKHVIVMTDGLSQPGDFDGVLKDLEAIGATVSFVGIGDGADRAQLTHLARLGGGAFHMTTDFRALPSIMAQEAMMLSVDPIQTGRPLPRWTEPQADFLRGLAVAASPPPLEAYVRTTAKPGASVHLVDSLREDSPLFATWRYGLGHVAAFASQALGPWAPTWIETAEFARFWSQILRWTVPRVVRPGLNVTVKPSTSESATLVVRAVDRDYKPLSNLELAVVIDDPSTDRVLHMAVVPEFQPGTYVTQVPLGVEVELRRVRVEVDANQPGAPAGAEATLLTGGLRSPASAAAGPTVQQVESVTGGRRFRNPSSWAAVEGSLAGYRLSPRGSEHLLPVLALIAFGASLVARYSSTSLRLSGLASHLRQATSQGPRQAGPTATRAR
jgi:uncharacterized protein YegL